MARRMTQFFQLLRAVQERKVYNWVCCGGFNVHVSGVHVAPGIGSWALPAQHTDTHDKFYDALETANLVALNTHRPQYGAFPARLPDSPATLCRHYDKQWVQCDYILAYTCFEKQYVAAPLVDVPHISDHLPVLAYAANDTRRVLVRPTPRISKSRGLQESETRRKLFRTSWKMIYVVVSLMLLLMGTVNETWTAREMNWGFSISQFSTQQSSWMNTLEHREEQIRGRMTVVMRYPNGGEDYEQKTTQMKEGLSRDIYGCCRSKEERPLHDRKPNCSRSLLQCVHLQWQSMTEKNSSITTGPMSLKDLQRKSSQRDQMSLEFFAKRCRNELHSYNKSYGICSRWEVCDYECHMGPFYSLLRDSEQMLHLEEINCQSIYTEQCKQVISLHFSRRLNDSSMNKRGWMKKQTSGPIFYSKCNYKTRVDSHGSSETSMDCSFHTLPASAGQRGIFLL